MQQFRTARGPAHRDDIDAQRLGKWPEFGRERAQGPSEAVESFAVDESFRSRVVTAGLDLDCDPGPSTPDEQVDLGMTRSQIASLEPVAGGDQGSRGESLTAAAREGGAARRCPCFRCPCFR